MYNNFILSIVSLLSALVIASINGPKVDNVLEPTPVNVNEINIAIVEIEKTKEVEEEELKTTTGGKVMVYSPTNLGEFQLTAYCKCSKCCGKWSEIPGTASGAMPKANHTIAADKKFKFGTKLKINDTIYTVEDRGSAINGNHIDIYFDTHEEALEFGCQYANVYLVN